MRHSSGPWTRCCFRREIEGSNGRIMVDYGKGKSTLVGGQCRRSSQLDLIISVVSSIFLCIFTILSIRADTPYRPQHFSDLQNLRFWVSEFRCFSLGDFPCVCPLFFWVSGLRFQDVLGRTGLFPEFSRKDWTTTFIYCVVREGRGQIEVFARIYTMCIPCFTCHIIFMIFRCL